MSRRKTGELSAHHQEQTFANVLIDSLGGTKKVADYFHINMAAVSWWRKKGIPPLKLVKLAKLDESVKETEQYKIAIREIEELLK